MLLRCLLLSLVLPAVCLAEPKPPRVLQLSHAFPASASRTGDLRDRMAQAFAMEVEKRSSGALKLEVHPESGLMREDQQWEALTKGDLAASILPLSLLFARIPELQVTQLPCVIQSYEHALRWKDAPIGQDLKSALEKQGLVVMVWLWLPSVQISVVRPMLGPSDAKGQRVRSVDPAMDALMASAGATVVPVQSFELLRSLRDGKLDSVQTHSTGLADLKLQGTCKGLTTSRLRALCYFPMPLVFAKRAFDALSADERKLLQEAGRAVEQQVATWTRSDDQRLAESYLSNGALVADLDAEHFLDWQRFARGSAWREFEKKVPRGAELLQKALAVK